MLSTKVLTILGAVVLCAAAPAAYYFSPVLLAGSGTSSSRIVAAINERLLMDASLCWGTKQVSNVARYEAGQDDYLIYARRKIDGFTGALLDKRNSEMQELGAILASGAVGSNPKVETRRVSPAEVVETMYLKPVNREYWTRGKGLCLGVSRVTQLINYTEPAPNSQGVQTIQATFDFEVEDRAAWVEPRFAEALKRRQGGTARLTIHSKGYTVVGMDLR